MCSFYQQDQRCPKRRVAQAAIRLATAIIKFRNKERNVRSPKLNLKSRLHNSIYAINGQTKGCNNTNFESNLAMMVIYLPVKFEFDWTNLFELESGNENVDGQTDSLGK